MTSLIQKLGWKRKIKSTTTTTTTTTILSNKNPKEGAVYYQQQQQQQQQPLSQTTVPKRRSSTRRNSLDLSAMSSFLQSKEKKEQKKEEQQILENYLDPEQLIEEKEKVFLSLPKSFTTRRRRRRRGSSIINNSDTVSLHAIPASISFPLPKELIPSFHISNEQYLHFKHQVMSTQSTMNLQEAKKWSMQTIEDFLQQKYRIYLKNDHQSAFLSGPHFVARGKIASCTLEDVMQSIYCETTQGQRELYSFLYGQSFLDGAVLNVLEKQKPTGDDPFWFLGIKWLAIKMPFLEGLLSNRDWVFLEHSSTKKCSVTGQKYLQRIIESVSLDEISSSSSKHFDASSMNLVRGEISVIYTYWMDEENQLNVTMKGSCDGGGKLPTWILNKILLRFCSVGTSIQEVNYNQPAIEEEEDLLEKTTWLCEPEEEEEDTSEPAASIAPFSTCPRQEVQFPSSSLTKKKSHNNQRNHHHQHQHSSSTSTTTTTTTTTSKMKEHLLSENCHVCTKPFGFLRARYECTMCHTSMCWYCSVDENPDGTPARTMLRVSSSTMNSFGIDTSRSLSARLLRSSSSTIDTKKLYGEVGKICTHCLYRSKQQKFQSHRPQARPSNRNQTMVSPREVQSIGQLERENLLRDMKSMPSSYKASPPSPIRLTVTSEDSDFLDSFSFTDDEMDIPILLLSPCSSIQSSERSWFEL